jgi:hypothetical protein
MHSSVKNWAFLAVAVTVTVVCAMWIFRSVKQYAGGESSTLSTRKRHARCESSTLRTRADDRVHGTLRTYAIRVAHRAVASLKEAGMSPPVFEDTAYVSCSGSADNSKVVHAEHRNAMWLPLALSSGALELHDDVAGGRVKHIVLTGAVLHVWALPPSHETRGSVLFAVSLPEDVDFPDSGDNSPCERRTLLPVLQPFREWDAVAPPPKQLRANVRTVIQHTRSPLLQIWAF